MSDLVLDGLDLNDGTDYILQSIEMPPPPKRPVWLSHPDTDGDALLSESRYERRVVTLTIRVDVQSTMNTAIDKLAALEDKLQLAERTQGGIPLVWTPINSTYSVTLYVLLGAITSLPMESTGENIGYAMKTPLVQVRLDCKPFGYGDQVTTSTVTNTAPLQELEVADVPGDVDAEAAIIVTDGASQNRMHVEVGRQTFGYDPGTPPDLILAKSDLTATGFAGSSTTRSGSYGANVWRATLTNAPVTICGTNTSDTDSRNHVGTYRAKLRCYASGTGPYSVRLSWRAGSDTPFTSNAWAVALNDQWSEVDLGLISIEPVPTGQLQTWEGRIEAQTGTPADTLDVDYLLLIPAEQYGIGRGLTISSSSGPLVAYETFNGETLGVALSGTSAPLGGTWQEAGDTGDFLYASPGGVGTSQYVTRSITADADLYTGQYATLDGSSTIAGVDAQVDVDLPGHLEVGKEIWGGVVVRFADADNWFGVVRRHATAYYGGTPETWLSVYKSVTGTPTRLANVQLATSHQVGSYTVRVTVDAAGNWAAYSDLAGTDGQARAQGQDSALATGQALEDGQVGIYDATDVTGTYGRNYDNFTVSETLVQSATYPAIYSGQSVEFRSDAAERENAAGTAFGDIPAYRGAHFFLPPAGAGDRTSRIVAKARRADVNDLRDAIQADDNIADSTTLGVKYTPRYLAIPRS